MSILPDMIIIDFCSWLKKNVIHKYDNLNIFNLISDEQYKKDLQEYASHFLHHYKPSAKSILHQFIESEYFDTSMEKCDKAFRNRLGIFDDRFLDERFIHHIFHRGNFDKSFSQFYNTSCANCISNIQPQELIDAAYDFFRIKYGVCIREDKH